jgi:hypothetical protein
MTNKPLKLDKTFLILGIFLIAFNLSGCFIIPEALPILGHERKKHLLYTVVKGVQCEIAKAVSIQLSYDRMLAMRGEKRKLEWLENWVSAIDIILNIKDKVEATPGVSLNTPNWLPARVRLANSAIREVPQDYKFGIGGHFEYEVAREDTVHYVYSFSEFKDHLDDLAWVESKTCFARGGVTIEADLKLDDWLDAALEPIKKCSFLLDDDREEAELLPFSSGDIKTTKECRRKEYKESPIGSLSHKINFDLVFNGNVTPTWSLVRVSTNSNPLFGATRNDNSTLIITFSPPAKESRKPVANSARLTRRTLSEPAQPTSEASQRQSDLFLGTVIRNDR